MQRFFGNGTDEKKVPHSSTTTQDDIDRTALRSLIIHRRQAAAAKEGVQVFHSNSFSNVASSIEGAVNKGKLAVRTDRDMYADLGLREQLTRLMLSYQSEWLQLALETVFGESVQKNYENWVLEKRRER